MTGSVSDGTVMSAPSAASAKVIGTVSVGRAPPAEQRVRADVHDHVEVAGRAAVVAGLAAPFTRMRWPSSTPAGMRTFTWRWWRSTPVP